MRHRPATRDDAALLFAWANDPETRRQSFTTEPIAWETHVAWLERRLADSLILIFENPEPVGVVRIQDGVISITVAPEHRGKGYATPMIREAAQPGTIAEVKPDNVASLRAFAAAGFVEISRTPELLMLRLQPRSPALA